MNTNRIEIVPKHDDARVEPGQLLHLDDMHGFMVADPVPDVRGWDVTLLDGRRVGSVDDLIVDTTDMTARYVEVKVDHEVLGTDEEGWVLIPVEAVRIDDAAGTVQVERLPRPELVDVQDVVRRWPDVEVERLQRLEADEERGEAR